MDSKTALAPFLNKLKGEVFASIVEETMKDMPPPHSNSLEPKHVQETKTRQEAMDFLSGQASLDKIAAGFDAIVHDLSSHLSPSDMEKISEEWTHGVATWIALVNPEDKSKREMPDSLQEMMGISEETMSHFYQAGSRYFEHNDFQKASDVFYVIISLDPRRHNVWVALGLAEARNLRYEPALISFSMASITDMDDHLPYIYSAQCSLKCNRPQEAEIYLNLAKESVEKSSLKDKQKLLGEIQNVRLSIVKGG